MESDMLYNLSSEGKERQTAFFKCVKKASEATHTIVLANRKSQKAHEAIARPEKETKWTVLQEYMREYTPFINSTTTITGICAQPVDINFYHRLTLNELDYALQITIGFVYFREALRSVEKATYKNCLKKLLKQTRLFDDSILELL